MILVDTSIWADHFRAASADIPLLLARDLILHHPFVTGELALGNPTDRTAMVLMLESLPQTEVQGWKDLLEFADLQQLGGTGIGYVDAHLLASAHSHRARLWTRDKRLHSQAERLDLAFLP